VVSTYVDLEYLRATWQLYGGARKNREAVDRLDLLETEWLDHNRWLDTLREHSHNSPFIVGDIEKVFAFKLWLSPTVSDVVSADYPEMKHVISQLTSGLIEPESVGGLVSNRNVLSDWAWKARKHPLIQFGVSRLQDELGLSANDTLKLLDAVQPIKGALGDQLASDKAGEMLAMIENSYRAFDYPIELYMDGGHAKMLKSTIRTLWVSHWESSAWKRGKEVELWRCYQVVALTVALETGMLMQCRI
jgi:hypothetical protein